ncbi:MAG: YlmH/Sll1252 family protein [Lachnospiraceae bacterium]|nr:YlmH/Sll1252 family protein [Lachnospiraceae bacterium]
MEESFVKRIKDLMRVSELRDVTKHTGFLTGVEQAEFLQTFERTEGPFLCGGHTDPERAMAVFPASYADMDAIPSELISCIRITPVNKKFADDLTHRDFLGALMNLQIERDCIGDILIKENTAYIYCISEMKEVITDGLTRVKHTEVNAEAVSLSECDIAPDLKEMKANVASERLDAVIAAVFKLPRAKASETISSGYVFLDGREASGNAAKLKEGMKISVRGHGKFIYDGIEAESRRGRLFVKLRLYV